MYALTNPTRVGGLMDNALHTRRCLHNGGQLPRGAGNWAWAYTADRDRLPATVQVCSFGLLKGNCSLSQRVILSEMAVL